MAQSLKLISERTFLAGYNDKDKPEDLRKEDGTVYMADIKNGFIEENKIVKRSGYSSIGNAPVETAILGQATHEPSGGDAYILRARNNDTGDYSVVESWDGNAAHDWAELTGATTQTADALHEFVTAENATYIFNGTDTVRKTTNGTSTSTVAAIPKGVDARWWHNFFFVFGVTGYKSRLYFSDVNEPETFDAVNGYIDINTDDNEDVYAIAAIKDELLIFKESVIFTLTGYGTTDFTLSSLSDFGTGIGTKYPRSVVETGNDIFFLTYYGAVPHFKSIKRTTNDSLVDGGIISDPITGTMNRMVTTALNNTAGVFDGRRVWYAVTTTGTTNNEVLVFDLLLGAWTRLTGINAAVFNVSSISGKRQIYFGSSTANGLSYHLDTATDDNGEAIDFVVDTPMYAPLPGHKCRYKYLYLTGDVETDVDIDVDYSPDGFTFQDLGTINLTGYGAKFGSAIWGTSKFGATTVARDRLNSAGGTAYYMQYRFTNNTANEDVAIREWELFYKIRGLRAA